MAITYASGTGTIITSHLVSQTLGTQTGGNNQIQLGSTTAVPSGATGYGGNVGNGANGLGDVYVGRRIVLRVGTGTEEIRRITAASGSNPTLITVNRDWDTNPTSGDAAFIPYEPGDIEDGGAGGGINYNTRTGLWELSNLLTINASSSLEVPVGQALELDDRGTNLSAIVNGYVFFGFDGVGGAYVDGGISPCYNNVAGEPSWQIASGGRMDVYDTLFWAQLVTQQFENANGSDGRYYRCKFLNLTDELHLFGSIIRDCSVVGKGGTAEIIRVNAGTDCDGLVISSADTLETTSGDTTTETVTLHNVTFIGVTDLITLVNNKTWDMINPVWSATTNTDFNSAAVTGSAAINDQRSVDAIVQEADGTKLQNANVIVYENTLDDLVVEENSDVNGVAASVFNYREMSWTSGVGSTTTRSGHALRIDKWLYTPFVQDLVSDVKVDGAFTIASDDSIVQTTQATAITDGSGIVWNEDTNPSELFDFTLGSGTALAGMILTFSPSGAVGTITEIASGDSTAGEIHLKTRNGTAIANGDTFSRTGGTAGTFSGTYTNDSKQPFSIWLEANAKSYQVQHDYWAARTAENPLNSIGEIAHEWGRGQQGRVIYKIGGEFSTERSNGKGIYIVNGGAGTVSHFTDDAGNTWVPPATATLQVTAAYLGSGVEGVKVRYEESDGTLIANGTTNASGIYSFGIATGLLPYNNAKVIVRDKRFEDPPDTVLNITTAGFELVIGLQPDTDINLP